MGGQRPHLLWIGCSDSRVPAEQILDCGPGELFIHRNVANIVAYNDINIASVVQYATQHLGVPDIVVCGHYGCGGVKAAMGAARHGLIDNWLRTLKDTQDYYWQQLAPLDETTRLKRMVELNVVEQVYNLGKTSIVQKSWAISGKPYVHGWVFDINTGYIRPQTGMINSDAAIRQICKFGNRNAGADVADGRAVAAARLYIQP